MGDEMDQKFLEKVKTVSISPDVVKRHKNIKIIYTPIHGTGVKLVPAALRNLVLPTFSMFLNRMWLVAIFQRLFLQIPKKRLQWTMAIKKA
jgi:phosphoglucomutase